LGHEIAHDDRRAARMDGHTRGEPESGAQADGAEGQRGQRACRTIHEEGAQRQASVLIAYRRLLTASYASCSPEPLTVLPFPPVGCGKPGSGVSAPVGSSRKPWIWFAAFWTSCSA